MKVKDFVGWLQSTGWTSGGFVWHYYPTKGVKTKSACGQRNHPRTQLQAAYLIAVCRRCTGYCRENNIPTI